MLETVQAIRAIPGWNRWLVVDGEEIENMHVRIMTEWGGCMWPSWLERRLCMSLDLRGEFIVVPFFPGHNLVAPGGQFPTHLSVSRKSACMWPHFPEITVASRTPAFQGGPHSI